ncbi:MAG: lamin tail domain-containing protein [Patescibacteria group bacterium]
MIIKEFLPNPVGKDADGEYIKIFNDGDKAVILNGWSVKDASGKTFSLSGSLDGGKELSLPYLQTKISLNNNGEQIFLYDSAGKLVDELSYSGQAEEGKIIARIVNSESGIGEIGYGRLNSNSNLAPVFFACFLAAAILAGIGLYLVLQLEKKLDIKLF